MTAAIVDTNIAVYAYDPADPRKQQRAQDLLRELSQQEELFLSAQVLNEFSAVLLKRGTGRPNVEILEIVRELASLGTVLPLTEAATWLALRAVGEHKLSFWDALIWATARIQGLPRVYSEDFQHGRVLDGVEFINPFL
ncbi:MAG: PIN domain-containing protein [Thermoanaerobaculia bacterium]